MRVILSSLLIAPLLIFSGLVVAQTKPEDQEIRVDTDLIEVPFVITDKTGKPILNLKKDNFRVYEDGTLQTLTDFSATNAPFEVALVLDTSGSTLAELPLRLNVALLLIVREAAALREMVCA